LLNNLLHVYGIPENYRVDNQIQTICLVNLLFFKVASYLSLIGKMQKLPQIMNLFALSQLQIDITTKHRVLDVTKNKNGFLQPSVFLQHSSKYILLRASLQLGPVTTLLSPDSTYHLLKQQGGSADSYFILTLHLF